MAVALIADGTVVADAVVVLAVVVVAVVVVLAVVVVAAGVAGVAGAPVEVEAAAAVLGAVQSKLTASAPRSVAGGAGVPCFIQHVPQAHEAWVQLAVPVQRAMHAASVLVVSWARSLPG